MEDYNMIFNNPIFNDLKLARQTDDVNFKSFLESMSDDELRKIWKSYKLSVGHGYTMDNPMSIHMFENIDEGLMRTYSSKDVIKFLYNQYDIHPSQIKTIDKKEGVSYIKIQIPNVGDNVDEISHAMGVCGYYLSKPTRKELKTKINQWVSVQFEPRIRPDDTKQIRKEESTLIHITPQYNLGKIKHIGFSPRSKNELFDYPSRVYFIRGSLDMSKIIEIGQELSDNNPNEFHNGKYVLIKIDLNRVPDNIKFYIDTNYMDDTCIFTKQNIHPDVIIDIKEIQF